MNKDIILIAPGMNSPEFEIKSYTKLIEEHPENKELYEGRGWCYFVNEEYKKALADFQKASELDPQNTYYLFCCADCFERLKEWNNAFQEYKKIIEIDSKESSACIAAAEILVMQGKNDEAETFYNKAISAKDDRQNYFFRAYFYTRTKQYDKAIADFETILHLFPNDTDSLFLKNKVLREKSKGIQFEDVQKFRKKFLKLLDYFESTEEYIEKGIDWYRVNWCRSIYDYKKYKIVERERYSGGKISLYIIDKNKRVLHDKKTLAYTCDLYDIDGKLLNIALLGI